MNFEQLKAEVKRAQAAETMAKAHGNAGDFDSFDQPALIKSLRSCTKAPDTKGAHAALRKSMLTLTKAIPTDSVLGATNMEAHIAKPKRQYSAAEIESAAHKALAAGAITGAEANHIASHLAVSGRCPDEYMAKLTGHVPAKSRLLTKSQVTDAASAMLSVGNLSIADAYELDRCLSFNRPIRDDLMKSIHATHAGLK